MGISLLLGVLVLVFGAGYWQYSRENQWLNQAETEIAGMEKLNRSTDDLAQLKTKQKEMKASQNKMKQNLDRIIVQKKVKRTY